MEAAVMADHFDSINKLPEGVAGVPNWRCVPGYQVRCNHLLNLATQVNALNQTIDHRLRLGRSRF